MASTTNPPGIHQHVDIPLKHLDPVQRAAFGLVAPANELRLHVWIKSTDFPASTVAFCTHPDYEYFGRTTKQAQDHMPHVIADGCPDLVSCGSPNRFLYQLNRIVWAELRGSPIQSLTTFRKSITSKAKRMDQQCIVCGGNTNTSTFTSKTITCSNDCSIQLRSSHTEVRLPELITDSKAVKILLEAVRATTLGGNLGRLGNVPMARDVMLNVIETASPHIGEIASANPDTLLEGIKACGPHMESLLSWALSAYPGYLLSLPTVGLEAYGGLIGAFMLLGTASDRENAYAVNLAAHGGGPCTVFHGTTLDRLYPILQHGLELQGSFGGMLGGELSHGIYTTSDLAMALGYANAGSHAHTELGWEENDLSPTKVLLICELAAKEKWEGSPSVYVTTDPSFLAVRYVCLLNADFLAMAGALLENGSATVLMQKHKNLRS